ncbi:MAG: hypothetical protein LBH43_07300, partial [Treponema sp.]|nr:hypothetical protein [Treponema sp.]
MNTRFSTVGKAIGVIVVLAGFIACDNPFKAGLGEKVDVTPPEIISITPSPGSYIKEKNIIFTVKATDDMGVTKVDIRLKQGLSDKWVTSAMTSSGADLWTFKLDLDKQLNEKKITDGDFYMEITAWDKADHSTSSTLNSYIIKTAPPKISLFSPYVDEDFWVQFSAKNAFFEEEGQRFYDWTMPGVPKKPVLYQQMDIIGNAFDAQAVKSPYPKIKFWNPNNGETEEKTEWQTMDEYLGPEGWDEDDSKQSRNVGFKYIAQERDSNNKPNDTYLGQTTDLPYKFRILVIDVGDNDEQMVSYFPPAVFDKSDPEKYFPNDTASFPAAEMFMVVSEGPAQLDLFYNGNLSHTDFGKIPLPATYDINDSDSPFGQDSGRGQKYLNDKDKFVIEARASHGSGISKAQLVLIHKDKTETKLKWAQGISDDYNKKFVNQEFVFFSPKIGHGEKVLTVDDDDEPILSGPYGSGFPFEASDGLLKTGEYEFEVRVWDNLGECSKNGYLVQIIGKAPDITLTRVRAAKVDEEAVIDGAGDKYDLYTVNGVFDFSALVADDFGVESSKWWLIARDNDAADSEPSWVTPTTGYLDGRQIYAGGTGTTRLAAEIDTIALSVPDGKYTLYLRARGKAENPAISKCYIYVDQSTDIPTIDITSPADGSYVSNAGNLRGTFTDDDNVGRYTVEYWDDDAIPSAGYMIVRDYVLPTPLPEYSIPTNPPLALTGLNGFDTDGEKKLRITVYDHPGSKLGLDKTRSAKSQSKELTFTLDTTPPKVEFPQVFGVSHIYNAPFFLSGTVEEEVGLDNIQTPGNGLPKIKWTIAETGYTGFITTGDKPEYSWDISIPDDIFEDLDDGNYSIRFDAQDEAGNIGTS